jgi:hypothetical protein
MSFKNGIGFFRVALLLSVALFAIHSIAADLFLIQPATAIGGAEAHKSHITDGGKSEEYIVGRSPVALATNFLALCRMANVSDSLVMKFADATPGKPDKIFRARVSAPPDNLKKEVVTLSASLEGCELQTVLVTADSAHAMITIQDLNSGRIYRMNGDLNTGVGEVIEIDPSKMPPVIHLPPLVLQK